MVRTECDDSAFQRQDGPSVNVCRYRGTFVDCTHFIVSLSISLEGGSSKDRVRLCRLSTSFQECPHQKLFFDLKDKNYNKAKMKGGLGWMKKYNDPRSLFNGNHFSSIM